MKTVYYKTFILWIFWGLYFSFLTESLFANQISKKKPSNTVTIVSQIDDNLYANKPNKQILKKDKNSILILADKFTSDQKTSCATFTGNVKATQKNNVLTCGQLKIFYNRNDKENSMNSLGKSAKKIIAENNVHIFFDNNTAESDRAEYTTLTEILILTGENAKMTTKIDYISGNKIIYHKKDGRIFVEKGLNKQIEALIYQNNK